MKNFELFMGCLGNGITVCNKAVIENGDYKEVCHIADYGKITWYADPSNIPSSALKKIENAANQQKDEFMKMLEPMDKYRKLGFIEPYIPEKCKIYALLNINSIDDILRYYLQVLTSKSNWA